MTRIHPQQPTDHVTTLKQYYAEDEAKRRRQGELIAQQGKQNEVAVAAASPVKAFAGLASLSKTVRSGLATVEARKKTADTKYQKDIEGMLSMHPVLKKEIIDSIVDNKDNYKGERKNIFEDSKFLKPIIERLADKDKEALQALLKHDPRRLIILQETLARDFATQLPARVETWKNDLKAKGEWDLKDRVLNKEEYLQKIKDYKGKELAKFGISKEAIAAIASGELRRQNQTLRGTKTSVVDSELFRSNRALAYSLLKSAGSSIDLEALPTNIYDAVTLRAETDFKDIPDGPTAIQQATESVVADLIRLREAGFIPNGALAGLEGTKFPHPAGKNGKASVIDAFFSKDGEHFNRLIKAGDVGQNKILGTQTNLDTVRLSELKSKAFQVGLNDEDTAELDKIAHRGLIPDQSITDVRGISVSDNTPEAYTAEKETWEIELEAGNIVASKEAAKLIKNKKLRDEVLDKIKLHEKVRKRVNYSERWIDIKVAEGMNQTLKEDETLNERGIKVRNDLLKYFRRDFQLRLENDPDNPEAFNESIRAVGKYWTDNGGKNKDQKNPITGKFSVTNNGRYEEYDKYSGLVSSRRKNALLGSTKTNVDAWGTEITDAYKWAEKNPNLGGTVLERTAMMPGLLSPEDIIGAYENGVLSQEIITKARRMGVSPTALLKAQTKALQDSEASSDPPINSLRVLSQDQIDNFPNHEEALSDAIKRSRKGDLLYLLHRIGPENWSPKQFQRVRNELAKQAEFKHTVETQDEIESLNKGKPIKNE